MGGYVGQRLLLRETLTKKLESVGAQREALQVLKWDDFVAIADLVISEGAKVDEVLELFSLSNLYDLAGKPKGLSEPTGRSANYQIHDPVLSKAPKIGQITVPAGTWEGLGNERRENAPETLTGSGAFSRLTRPGTAYLLDTIHRNAQVFLSG